MNPPGTTAITLRALRGTPLADDAVRGIVVAAARALAERHGFELVDVLVEPDRVTCVINGDRTVALGFAAELRRTTNAWYAHRRQEQSPGQPALEQESLWGEAPVE